MSLLMCSAVQSVSSECIYAQQLHQKLVRVQGCRLNGVFSGAKLMSSATRTGLGFVASPPQRCATASRGFGKGKWKRSTTVVACGSSSSSATGLVAAKPPVPRSPWRTLLKLTLPDLTLIALALVALSLAAVGQASLPALQGSALNAALGLPTSGTEGLRDHITRLAVTGLATALFTGIRGVLFWFCGARLVARLRKTLFDALLAQPQAFHDRQSPGGLSSRLATDCVKLGDVLSLNLNIVLRQALQSVIGVAIICRINMQLAALVLLGVAVRGLLSHFYAKASRALSQAQQDALAASSGVASSCLSLIKVVRAHGTQAAEGRRYDRELHELLAAQQRQGVLYGGSRVANMALSTLLLAAVLGIGSSLVAGGVLPRESLTSFVLYVGFISESAEDIADQWSRTQEAMGAAQEVFGYLEPATSTAVIAATAITAVTAATAGAAREGGNTEGVAQEEERSPADAPAPAYTAVGRERADGRWWLRVPSSRSVPLRSHRGCTRVREARSERGGRGERGVGLEYPRKGGRGKGQKRVRRGRAFARRVGEIIGERGGVGAFASVPFPILV